MKTNAQPSSLTNEHRAMRAAWFAYSEEHGRLTRQVSRLEADHEQLRLKEGSARRDLEEITPMVTTEGQIPHPDTPKLRKKLDAIGDEMAKVSAAVQACRNKMAANLKALPASIILAIPTFREELQAVEQRAAGIGAHIAEQERALSALQQRREDTTCRTSSLRAKIALAKAHALLSGEPGALSEDVAQLAAMEAEVSQQAADISNIQMLLEGLQDVRAAVEVELKEATDECEYQEAAIARIAFERERKALINDIQALANPRLLRLRALGRFLRSMPSSAYDVLEDCRLAAPNTADISRTFQAMTTVPA